MNDWLSLLESSPEGIIAAIAMLLVAGLALGVLLRRPAAAQKTAETATTPTDSKAPPRAVASPAQATMPDDADAEFPATAPQASGLAEAPAPEMAADEESLSYEVDDVDVMTEIDVFIQFGYLEQAARSLRQHVDHSARHSSAQLGRLASLYLQLDDIDNYAEIVERLHDYSLLTREQLQDAVLEGLRVDRANLGLRVLADERLGLGVREIADILGPEETPAALSHWLQPEAGQRDAAEPPDIDALSARHLERRALLEGQAVLSRLSSREMHLIRHLLPPDRELRILLSNQEPMAAMDALERLLQDAPATPSRLLDGIRASYMARRLPQFCRYLWQFYVALGQSGLELKQKLLSMGHELGEHPALEALERMPDRVKLEAVGRHLGYIKTPSLPEKRLTLVESRRNDSDADLAVDALSEAEQFIEYGQIDMAVHTLEAAILANPVDLQLYPPLLSLYERLNDMTRFTWLTRQIRDRLDNPPEEVTQMMSRFVQSMQQRQHQQKMAA
ncbi:hypothetical protein [uncultured Aquitalea sp.]|uniref:hypothetical protein n=1 Tax=uncultured Aquitalea sp. TaxID=540272 RepID=UPI0025EB17D2|nr:hypothetical protein [uncultured Aquitalea sp.]